MRISKRIAIVTVALTLVAAARQQIGEAPAEHRGSESSLIDGPCAVAQARSDSASFAGSPCGRLVLLRAQWRRGGLEWLPTADGFITAVKQWIDRFLLGLRGGFGSPGPRVE